MSGRISSIVIGLITIAGAMFLAWRIGLWLETPVDQVPDVPIHAPTSPPFAKGQVSGDLHFELRDVRLKEERTRAEGAGIIRYSIRHQEVKPAAIAMLRALKGKAPEAEKITLVIRPTVEWPAGDIAEVAWEKGEAVLTYGIPSLVQIDEWNAKVSKNDDRPLLHVPDRETFSTGVAVIIAMNELEKQQKEATEDQLLEQAAKKVGAPYTAAKRSKDYIRAYYTGNKYGSEKFELKLP